MPGNSLFRELNDSNSAKDNFVVREIDEDRFTFSSSSVVVKIYSCCLDFENPKILSNLFLKRARLQGSVAQCSVASGFSGVVKRIGSSVTLCKVGDRVAGVLPLSSKFSGCGEICIIDEFNIVPIPNELDHIRAACIGVCVRAFTSVNMSHLERGETLLVMGGGRGFTPLVCQIAASWGANVFAVTTDIEEKNRLEKLSSPPHCVLELDANYTNLVSRVLEETGKLGVNVIIDNGVRQFSTNADMKAAEEVPSASSLPFKQDLISCLSVGARWIASCHNLQLDPPNSEQLFLRNASIHFLFSHSWTVSSSRQGKWLHMAAEVIRRLTDESLTPDITHVIPFSEALEFIQQQTEESARNLCVVVNMKTD